MHMGSSRIQRRPHGGKKEKQLIRRQSRLSEHIAREDRRSKPVRELRGVRTLNQFMVFFLTFSTAADPIMATSSPVPVNEFLVGSASLCIGQRKLCANSVSCPL